MPHLTDEQLRYNLESRSIPEMRRDLVHAFAEIRKLRENRLWLRIVTVSAIAEWGLILVLVEKILR